MAEKRDTDCLVDFLLEALGPDYEIIFYSLDQKNRGTITSRASMQKTGQEAGQPMPEEIQKLFDEGLFYDNPQQPAWTTVYEDGLIANTSLQYFDGTQQIERGILSVSLLVNKYFEMIQELLYMSNLDRKIPMPYSLEAGLKREKLIHVRQTLKADADEEILSLHGQMADKIREIVKKHMGVYANDSSKFSPKQRKAIMTELYQEGVFNVKGMIGTAAEALFCSEVSIYRYLAVIKK